MMVFFDTDLPFTTRRNSYKRVFFAALEYEVLHSFEIEHYITRFALKRTLTTKCNKYMTNQIQ